MFDLVPFRFKDLERGFLTDFFSDDFFARKLATFKTDITDNDKDFVIEAELPGFSKEDIQVEINDKRLTISAKKANETEEKKDNYIRKERYMGEVSRTFILENVNNDEIKADFKDGILKLTLPKVEQELPKVRKVELN